MPADRLCIEREATATCAGLSNPRASDEPLTLTASNGRAHEIPADWRI